MAIQQMLLGTFGKWPPIIDSTALVEVNAAGDRYTSQDFTVSITMTKEGLPISDKQLKSYIDAPGGGTLQRNIETDDVTVVNASTIGDNWTVYDVGGHYGYRGQWHDIAGNGSSRMFACGTPQNVSNGYNKALMYTNDGHNWGSSHVDGNPSTLSWQAIGYDGYRDIFAAISETGEITCRSSGTSFTSPNNDATAIGNGWRGIAANCGSNSSADIWVAVSYNAGKVAKSSIDVITHGSNTWTGITVTNKPWVSIAAAPNGGRFVAVNYASSGVNIMYSDNGSSWTDLNSPNDSGGSATYGWQDICYGNGKWVAVGNQGNQRAMWSSNGSTWNAVNTPRSNMSGTSDDQSWEAVTYGDGKFVAVGSGSVFHTMYSTDGGATWTGNNAGTNQKDWNSIAYTSAGGFCVLSSDISNGYQNMQSASATGAISANTLTFSGSTDLSLFNANDTVISYPSGAGGTVSSINTGSNQITLTPYTGTWTTGMTVIGDTIVNVSKLYTKMDANGTVTSLVPYDPGYTTMTGNPNYTLSFPATFPTGDSPDADITVGATFTVDVRATNSEGNSDATTNTVTPA